MIQRIALLAGGLGAAAVLAFALGLTNFMFAGLDATKPTANSQPAAQANDVSVAAADNSSGNGNGNRNGNGNGAGQGQGAQSQTKKVVDKVYIAPTPAPKVVHQTQPAPNAPSAQAPAPTQPKAPAAAPAWHESEHSSGHRGRQHGDD